MIPAPPADLAVDPHSVWRGIWTALVVTWIMAFAMAFMFADVSFRRHGWRCVPRFCLRACAVWGMGGMYLIYTTWGQPWTMGEQGQQTIEAFHRIINTPGRQAFVYGTMIAAFLGAIYLINAVAYTAYRSIRYVAKGPLWLPWHRELDRQIPEEFHGGPSQ